MLRQEDSELVEKLSEGTGSIGINLGRDSEQLYLLNTHIVK